MQQEEGFWHSWFGRFMVDGALQEPEPDVKKYYSIPIRFNSVALLQHIFISCGLNERFQP